MKLTILLLLVGLFMALVLWHRLKVSSRLIENWLNAHGYSKQGSLDYKQSIFVWVWPISANVITSNADGKFFKIKFSIGTIFGGYFNEKIKCVCIKQVNKCQVPPVHRLV